MCSKNFRIMFSSLNAPNLCNNVNPMLSHVKNGACNFPPAFDAANGSPGSIFSDIMNSISDAVFSTDGRYVVSRDYLTVKVWDIRVESEPAETINVHEHLRGHLTELYDNDCIFDKFEVAASSDTSRIITGSYNNLLHVYDRGSQTDVCIDTERGAQSLLPLEPSPDKALQLQQRHDIERGSVVQFDQKALHVAMHPHRETLAVAAGPKISLFNPATSSVEDS